MTLTRRSLLTRGAATGAGVALAGSFDMLFGGTPALADSGKGKPCSDPGEVGYGPLVSDPAGRLALPKGFTYSVIAQAGATRLDTGELTPGRPDGTASFVRRGGNGSVLVQNHEMSGSYDSAQPAVPQSHGCVYDPGVTAAGLLAAPGGTTTITVDRQGRRLGEVVSLAGTYNNCAGGRTPWSTWLSCEETEVRKGNGLTKDHGYVFEVSPYDGEANLDAKPLKFFGRFPHEAVAIDPETGESYLTEDASGPNGLLYRWTPPASALPLDKGVLKALADDAGTLAALRASSGGTTVLDLSTATAPGTTYDVSWVAVPDRDAVTVSTRKQFSYVSGTTTVSGPAGEITRSRKLEGMWWGDGGAYFVASFARTSDGSAVQHDGQVWFLDPLAQTIRLVTVFGYTPGDQDSDVDGPDNITVSPYGGVLLAEDGEGTQHLVGVEDDGRSWFFARNELPGDEEFTGPNFSPDRKTLFANNQVPGVTYAITGPFRKHGRH
jgi:secreted PhoX family phosphatase